MTFVVSGKTNKSTPADGDELLLDEGGGVYRALSWSAIKAILGVLDEDDFSTDSATRPPSQQSTKAFVENLVALLSPGHLYGLTLSNGTDTDHDIDIATGKASLKDGSGDNKLFDLISGLTKQVDANWAEGNDAGGFPSGLSLASDTTYHVFLIGKDDGTVDAGFDTDLSASNLLTDASSYSWFRRIGSLYTDGSSNWVQFSQLDDEFLIKPVSDYDDSDPGTSVVSRTLSVPSGIKVTAIHSANITTTQPNTDGFINVLFFSHDQEAEVPSNTVMTLKTSTHDADAGNRAVSAAQFYIRTNTSAQIRTDQDTSNANVTLRGTTHGWIDHRGRLS